MIKIHYAASVENFLDALAPDKENGLHQHNFVEKKPAEIESLPDSEDRTTCKVCDQEKKKHATF